MSDPSTVMLWGLPSDPPLAEVWRALEDCGCQRMFVDQRAVGELEVELDVGADVNGRLRFKDQSLDLAQVSGLYLRPFDGRDLPSVASAGPDSDLWRRAVAQQEILLSWSELTPALVLNRPSAMASNSSKPFQSAWIESLGFRIPDTLLTTDPDAALAFWKLHDRVIYKSVSGVRSIVTRLEEAHLARMHNIASCPTQFQQYIEGADYRVHVVGDQVFACAIDADADDYRYATGPIDMQPCQLPEDVSVRCLRIAAAMELTLAGVDLRRTPAGDWYCFEANPSPAFTFFEGKTGQPIAKAVASLLARGSDAR